MDVYEVDSSKRKESICFAAYANMRNSDGYCDYSFKDESFSFQLKEIGDQYYEKKKYRKAVSYFNKALCYAVKDSEIMEALYAKRSTLAVAIESIESKNDADNFFHLLCAPNVKSPFMMDSLQIIKDKKKKCLCLISKNDLMVGDVIAVQKPFASILVDHSLYKHCSNCMKESALKLIPCDVCVSVMFCSENCKIAGFEIHQHECRIVDELILKFDIKREIPYHRFRALFKALSLFDGSAEKMKEFLEGKDTTSKLSTLDLCNNEKLFLKVAYSLKYSDFEDQQIKPLYYSFYPKLIEIMTNPKMVSFIMNFMAKIPFSAVARRNTNFKNQRNGGYYQLQTVLDPSCAPNVLGIILNDCKIVYVVQHPIRAGEKITITNGSDFQSHNRRLRQEAVFLRYNFRCTCVGCTFCYQTLDTQKIPDRGSTLVDALKVKFATRFDGMTALCLFKENSEYIQQHYHEFPTHDITINMLVNMTLLDRLCWFESFD